KIGDGSIVADIGAAGGWFTVRLSRRVGPNGAVYAEDIQPLMLEAIKRRVQRENLTNVRTVLGTTKGSRLPHGLDAILINGAFHEMENPVAVLKDAAESDSPRPFALSAPPTGSSSSLN
ncbi:MAG: class I SAM-dependent methyltransferase, partial [Alphaproteobacteria bacterium]